jgi:membrane-bound metal-dependent hydrolase YbcI (DUF457 family)
VLGFLFEKEMASFIGHSLTAFAIHSLDKANAPRFNARWMGWLILIATVPDIDYLIRPLRTDSETIRITHSIFLTGLLPFATIVVLALLGNRGEKLKAQSVQVFAAGFSHLLLDFLVGVWALPLLWPLSSQTYKLAFGILPSAAQINLINPYLYLNTTIELGVLAPMFFAIYSIKQKRHCTIGQKIRLIVLWLVSICFAFWASTLER